MQKLYFMLIDIIEALKREGATIAFAESCTGGKIASALTSISGASAVFEGAMVTYSNRIKHEWLGVDSTILKQHGAVSKACVEAMLLGIAQQSGAAYAIAVSGIAGPTGGTPQKPVGTVYIGVKTPTSMIVNHYCFDGDRVGIQEQSVLAAYEILFSLLIDN